MYSSWTSEQLKAECVNRGLKASGTDEVLLDRLETTDSFSKKRTRDVTPAFFRACCIGTVEDVISALEDGASVNAISSHSLSALMMACSRKDEEGERVVDVLLKRGALHHLRDMNGDHMLFYAALRSTPAMVEKLVKAYPNYVHLTNNLGDTPLLKLTGSQNQLIGNFIQIAKLLLIDNYDINTTNKNGETALSLACKGRSVELVKLMIEHKADLNTNNKNDRSPFSIACVNKFIGPQIIPLLAEAGAKRRDRDLLFSIIVGEKNYVACEPYYRGQRFIGDNFPLHLVQEPVWALRTGIFRHTHFCYAKMIKDNVKPDIIWSVLRVRRGQPVDQTAHTAQNCSHHIFDCIAESDNPLLWNLVAAEMQDQHHPLTGDTLLHVAVRSGKRFALEEVLKQCANPFLRNINGDIPIRLATDAVIRARLSLYMQFKFNKFHISKWRGPYFAQKASAIMRVMKKKKMPRDVTRVTLQWLSIFETN